MTGIEFVSATEETEIGDNYDVNITTAASQGTMIGDIFDELSVTPITIDDTNNSFKLKVNGTESDLMKLTSRTYTNTDQLVTEIQNKIDSDSKIGTRGLTVEWVDLGANGYLKFTSSTYGESSKVERLTSISNAAYGAIGLLSPETTDGTNVAGTINGEEAKGIGQLLKGLEDDAVEGTINITKGIAARLRDKVNSYILEGDGLLDRKVISYEKQIEDLTDQISKIDSRLESRRESLYKQYYAMENALAEFKSTSDFLTTQLAGLNSNWKSMQNS